MGFCRHQSRRNCGTFNFMNRDIEARSLKIIERFHSNLNLIVLMQIVTSQRQNLSKDDKV